MVYSGAVLISSLVEVTFANAKSWQCTSSMHTYENKYLKYYQRAITETDISLNVLLVQSLLIYICIKHERGKDTEIMFGAFLVSFGACTN